MPRSRTKSLRQPDAILQLPLGRYEMVALGDLTVGRAIAEPGWRWSEHIKPLVGTSRCQSTAY